jgi:hypothetical protein
MLGASLFDLVGLERVVKTWAGIEHGLGWDGQERLTCDLLSVILYFFAATFWRYQCTTGMMSEDWNYTIDRGSK